MRTKFSPLLSLSLTLLIVFIFAVGFGVKTYILSGKLNKAEEIEALYYNLMEEMNISEADDLTLEQMNQSLRKLKAESELLDRKCLELQDKNLSLEVENANLKRWKRISAAITNKLEMSNGEKNIAVVDREELAVKEQLIKTLLQENSDLRKQLKNKSGEYIILRSDPNAIIFPHTSQPKTNLSENRQGPQGANLAEIQQNSLQSGNRSDRSDTCSACHGRGKVWCSRCSHWRDGICAWHHRYGCDHRHHTGRVWHSKAKKWVDCSKCDKGLMRCSTCMGIGKIAPNPVRP